jgi:hypothetical protein
MKPTPASETPIVNPNMTLTGLGGTISKKTLIAIGNALLRRDPTRSFGEVAKVLSAQGPQRDAYHAALVDALNRRQSTAAVASRVGDVSSAAALAAGMQYLRDRERDRLNKQSRSR